MDAENIVAYAFAAALCAGAVVWAVKLRRAMERTS